MAHPKKRPEDLRSHRWFGLRGLRSFTQRLLALQMGYTIEDFAGKPVIALAEPYQKPFTTLYPNMLATERLKKFTHDDVAGKIERPTLITWCAEDRLAGRNVAICYRFRQHGRRRDTDRGFTARTAILRQICS